MVIIFGKQSKEGYKDSVKGVRQKTLCYGSRTLMTEFLLDKDNILPTHSHPYEQTGYLVKGHILLKIGDKQYDTLPGDSWCIPADVTHGAQIIEDSIAIEIFSPVREDYIPKEANHL
jgi:quercetin dioxygenase-like cupin family protein